MSQDAACHCLHLSSDRKIYLLTYLPQDKTGRFGRGSTGLQTRQVQTCLAERLMMLRGIYLLEVRPSVKSLVTLEGREDCTGEGQKDV